MSTILRRTGAHSRSIVAAVAVFSLVMALAVPAFGATASSVRVRVEGEGGTVSNGVRTVGATAITDSSGASFSPTTAPTPLAALAGVSQLGGFPFLVKDYGFALMVTTVNGEEPSADRGWMFRINGSETTPGNNDSWYTADGTRLHSGDDVLWYFGAWDASPTVATPVSTLVKVGHALTVTATQLDPHGVDSALAGAAVHVGSRTATSSADGVVSLPMTAVGDYGVRVDKPGFIRSAVTTVHVRKDADVGSLAVTKSKIRHGASSIFSGVLTSGSSKLSGKHVRIWHHTAGASTWIGGSTKVTDSAGRVRFSVSPSHSTYYRITYAGSSTYAPVTSGRKLVSVH